MRGTKAKLATLAGLGALLAVMATTAARADGLNDPAILHVGPGAGTSCATGCAGDPDTIGSGGFDIYYNSQGNGNLNVGSGAFYLIIATPDIAGQPDVDVAPTISGTATMYTPYPLGTTTPVTISGATQWADLTNTTDDLYTDVGLGPLANNSFQMGNMLDCDLGLTGQNACPNQSLQGNGPLAGKTITGFDVYTYNIDTTNFGPGDLLDFTGTLPIGSYVAAIGCDNCSTVQGAGGEAWAVPFTESGLVVSTPEPSSLLLMLFGMAALAFLYRRKQQVVA